MPVLVATEVMTRELTQPFVTGLLWLAKQAAGQPMG